jgi:hypothetical protein
MTTPTRYEALMMVADFFPTQEAMAEHFSVSQPTVWRWLNQSRQLPAEHVLLAEQLTGVPGIICVPISIRLILRPARAGMAPING